MRSGLGMSLQSQQLRTWQNGNLPPGGARGVLPAREDCFRGELMSRLGFPFPFPFGATGDEWKKSGEEDWIFCRLAWGVACTEAGRDRRGAGEDMFL